MSFGGCNYSKLKTNLRLAINRFKLLEKKKTELALKARKEIADYITNGKEDRARIRVEHIVREDYLVEAMEILEMYCDLLLARFGLIQTQKELDPGLEESVASLIWATPRLQAEVHELKLVQDQFTAKYKKEFVQACRTNTLENVNEKLMHKMSVQAPPKLLIEKYMIEIARTYNVPFVPDPTIMADDEVYQADSNLIDFGGAGKPPGGPPGFPPGAPGGGGGGHMLPPAPAAMPHQAGYPTPNQAPYPTPSIPTRQDLQPPPLPTAPPSAGGQAPVFVAPGANPGGSHPADVKYSPPPSYQPQDSAPGGYPPPASVGGPPPPQPSFPASTPEKNPAVDFPELPSVPGNTLPPGGGAGGASSGGDDVDFDDLTRRFQELKKRK